MRRARMPRLVRPYARVTLAIRVMARHARISTNAWWIMADAIRTRRVQTPQAHESARVTLVIRVMGSHVRQLQAAMVCPRHAARTTTKTAVHLWW